MFKKHWWTIWAGRNPIKLCVTTGNGSDLQQQVRVCILHMVARFVERGLLISGETPVASLPPTGEGRESETKFVPEHLPHPRMRSVFKLPSGRTHQPCLNGFFTEWVFLARSTTFLLNWTFYLFSGINGHNLLVLMRLNISSKLMDFIHSWIRGNFYQIKLNANYI